MSEQEQKKTSFETEFKDELSQVENLITSTDEPLGIEAELARVFAELSITGDLEINQDQWGRISQVLQRLQNFLGPLGEKAGEKYSKEVKGLYKDIQEKLLDIEDDLFSDENITYQDQKLGDGLLIGEISSLSPETDSRPESSPKKENKNWKQDIRAYFQKTNPGLVEFIDIVIEELTDGDGNMSDVEDYLENKIDEIGREKIGTIIGILSGLVTLGIIGETVRRKLEAKANNKLEDDDIEKTEEKKTSEHQIPSEIEKILKKIDNKTVRESFESYIKGVSGATFEWLKNNLAAQVSLNKLSDQDKDLIGDVLNSLYSILYKHKLEDNEYSLLISVLLGKKGLDDKIDLGTSSTTPTTPTMGGTSTTGGAGTTGGIGGPPTVGAAPVPSSSSYDMDKPIGQWTIEECFVYIMQSTQQSRDMTSQGERVNSRFDQLVSQESDEATKKYWLIKRSLHDVAVAYESWAKDFSINQGAYFKEGSEITTKGIDREAMFVGVLYHPTYGKYIQEIHEVIEEVFLTPEKDGAGPKGTEFSAASLKTADMSSGRFQQHIREKYEEKKTLELRENHIIGEDKSFKIGIDIKEHVFETAMQYAQVFDLRHHAFLEATKRAVTRGFGGEDPTWRDNPFAFVAYYLQRYKMIPDAKVLTLLFSNVNNSRNEELPLPEEWIDEAYQEWITEIRELLIEFYDVYIDVEKLIQAIEESGFELQDFGSIFPTSWTVAHPVPAGQVNSAKKPELTPSGDLIPENLDDLRLYKIGIMGWETVLEMTFKPFGNLEEEEIISLVDEFHRAIGKAKMIRRVRLVNGEEVADPGNYLNMIKPLLIFFYMRLFQKHKDKSMRAFYHLKAEIVEKVKESAGSAEGVPADIRKYAVGILNNKKYSAIFTPSRPKEFKKITYLRHLNGLETITKKLQGIPIIYERSANIANQWDAITGKYEMKLPYKSEKVSTSTKE